jgi:hypothetical protein
MTRPAQALLHQFRCASVPLKNGVQMAFRFSEFDQLTPLGRLGDYFAGLAAWRLVALDFGDALHILRFADPLEELPFVLGRTGPISLTADILWVDDEGVFFHVETADFSLNASGDLAFSANEATERARISDSLFVSARPLGNFLVVFTPNGSTLDNQLRWMFDLPHDSAGFAVANPATFASKSIGIAETIVLASLGLVQAPM